MDGAEWAARWEEIKFISKYAEHIERVAVVGAHKWEKREGGDPGRHGPHPGRDALLPGAELLHAWHWVKTGDRRRGAGPTILPKDSLMAGYVPEYKRSDPMSAHPDRDRRHGPGRLGRRPADLRRGHRDGQRHDRDRAAVRGSPGTGAPARTAASSRATGETAARLGGALARVRALRVRRRRGGQRLRGRRTRAAAASAGACSRQLVRASEEAGVWTLQAGIFPENVASLAIHELCGFRVVGVREKLGKLDGVWRDVALLERRSPRVGF